MSAAGIASVDTTPVGLVSLANAFVRRKGRNPSGDTAEHLAGWWIRFASSVRSHGRDPSRPTVADDLRPFVESYVTAYFSKYPDRKRVNPNTYNALVSSLKSYFRAVGAPVLETEWAEFPFQRTAPDLRVLSSADVRAMLSTAESDDRMDLRHGPSSRSRFAVVHTLAHSGLRRSELVGLRPSDLRPGDSELFVSQGKEGRDRLVVCAPSVFAVLQDHLRLHPATGETAPIFRMSVDTVERIVHGASYAVDGGGVTAHDLRRTYSNELREAGVEDRLMDLQLGHLPQGVGNQRYWNPSRDSVRRRLLPVLEGLYLAPVA